MNQEIDIQEIVMEMAKTYDQIFCLQYVNNHWVATFKDRKSAARLFDPEVTSIAASALEAVRASMNEVIKNKTQSGAV